MRLSLRLPALLTLTLFFSGFSLFSYAQYPTGKFVVGEIILKGNEKTKHYIIQRELTFSKGDTLVMEELIHGLDKSRENLLRLPLFHFVRTQVEKSRSGEAANITFRSEERRGGKEC